MSVLINIIILLHVQVINQGAKEDATYFVDQRARRKSNTSSDISRQIELANSQFMFNQVRSFCPVTQTIVCVYVVVVTAAAEKRVYGVSVYLCMCASVFVSDLSPSSPSFPPQIEASLIDRIFTQSTRLSSSAIVQFVRHLCKVSRSELSNPTKPRVFSLQKIVEITFYNMGRIRAVWAQIWSYLSKHFVFAGLHENAHICLYAVDALRRLATTFLEKTELTNYNFQVCERGESQWKTQAFSFQLFHLFFFFLWSVFLALLSSIPVFLSIHFLCPLCLCSSALLRRPHSMCLRHV